MIDGTSATGSLAPSHPPAGPGAQPRPLADRVLFRPVDIAALVVFRIAFGAIIIWEVGRYFEYDSIAEYWIRPTYQFPFEWFPWVQPWNGNGMYVHFAAMGVLAFMVMVGLWYRTSAALLFLAFAYVFLAEQTRYLNHFYLVILFSFLMIFIPANRAFSIDALLRRKIRSAWVPSWSLGILRVQMGVVYFFGGLAKLNYDWLVRGEPMRQWLAARQDFPLIGQFFTTSWVPHFMGISGAAIDLAAPFLLLFPKTRPAMFTILLAFHFMNDRLFNIGIFPWFAIVATTLFLPPAWPKRLWADLRVRPAPLLVGSVASMLIGLYFHREFEIVPALIAAVGGALVVWTSVYAHLRPEGSMETAPSLLRPPAGRRQLLVTFLCGWVAVQLFLPVRHYLIPGIVGWTEEGHRFAWRMKLRSKSGRTSFYAYHPRTFDRFEINTDSLLTPWQYSEMAGRPHLLREFARHLKKKLAREGKGEYEIRVLAFASLNFRPFTPLVDSTVDLGSQPHSAFRHNPWIIQLDEAEYWMEPASGPEPAGVEDR